MAQVLRLSIFAFLWILMKWFGLFTLAKWPTLVNQTGWDQLVGIVFISAVTVIVLAFFDAVGMHFKNAGTIYMFLLVIFSGRAVFWAIGLFPQITIVLADTIPQVIIGVILLAGYNFDKIITLLSQTNS